jgi:hypothetical protein
LSPQLASKSGEPITPAHFKYNNVEYMHIPWDHNSSLSQELPAIVDHILERSDQGKKILVHCQVYSYMHSPLTHSAGFPVPQLLSSPS